MGVKVIIDRKPLIVKIPIKPYLVSFLTKKYGPYHKATKWSLLGLEAIEILSSNYSKPEKIIDSNFFTLKIPYEICKKHGHFVDYTKIPNFQKKIEKLFKELLVDHILINNRIEKHGNIMKSIHNFYTFYSISESDLSLDYVYKLVQRAIEKETKFRYKNNSIKTGTN
jgi:hypothetical protein